MIEEKDPINQIEHFKLMVKELGSVHQSLMEYLGISNCDISHKKINIEEKSEEMYRILLKNNFSTNKSDFREFLRIILHLWAMNSSKEKISLKIECLFHRMREEIKYMFTGKEIFELFRPGKNKLIYLILMEQNIISIETIIENLNQNKINDCFVFKYFYPEIRKYDEKYFNEFIMHDKIKGLKKFVEENDQNLELYFKRRKEEEKDPKIVELIKEDKIDEFILLIEHYQIDLNKKINIKKTLFGKNKKELTPIEYSALFGSVAIFKYLQMKHVKINIKCKKGGSNIIEYAIKGRNYEIIHLLEERKEIIEELRNHKKQQKYQNTSIKMHHNEILEYFIYNYDFKITNKATYFIIINRNYHLLDQLIETSSIEFKDKAIIANIFKGFCQNRNEKMVTILLNQPNLDINTKNGIFL